MNNRHSKPAGPLLWTSIAIGIVLLGVWAWLFFTGELQLLEQKYALTYIVAAILAIAAAGSWLARLLSQPAKQDSLRFFYRCCGMLSLLALAVIFIWNAIGDLPSSLGASLVLLAFVLVVAIQILSVFYFFKQIRGGWHR